jgi:outer membrane receptor for ferrienterochelin and colicins
MNKLFILLILIFVCVKSSYAQEKISGKIYGIENGNKRVLVGANIIFLGTNNGTSTGIDGSFDLKRSSDSDLLIVSYVGFETDTIKITDENVIEITLNGTASKVEDVEVVGVQSSVVLDYKGIENKQIVTKRELQKAACCDLSESFETNPAVDVSLTDAITGVKQIEMLGLSGTYTQKTMEAIPFIRGLISNIGLTFIPGTWIESINVSKGIGSVVNGFESITGQIDISMAKPFDPFGKDIFVNAYGNNDQRYEGNLNIRKSIGDNLSTITLLHASSRQHEPDINNDNFMDLPRYNTFNILQKWKLITDFGFESQLGVQYLQDKKEGGTIGNNSALSPSASYKFSMDNRNFRIYGKSGYIFPNSDYKSVGFQWAFSKFDNESTYGSRIYSGNQTNGFINFIYQSSFGDESHKFRTGLSFLFDEYDETYNAQEFNRTERIPGAYFEYTYAPDPSFSAVAGLRLDEHNYYGTMFTPRFHLRYAPNDDLIFRLVGGKGYRTANIFTEYSSIFVSSRQLEIASTHSFGYGLEQEEAWNYGFNITHYFLYQWREATISADFYRTDFVNAIIADVDTDPNKVTFNNVSNGISSNSFQIELNIEPFERIETRLAYRFLDVKHKINNDWKSKPLTSKHRALFNLGYRTENYDTETGWSYDLTLKWFGTKRIPQVPAGTDGIERSGNSPDFMLVNTQLTKRFEFGFDLYLGVENLFNFRQKDPIIDPTNPNGDFFDASLVWGPVSGRMAYAGIRLEM